MVVVVDDRDIGIVNRSGDADDLDVGVVDEGAIDGGERDGVVDKEGHPPHSPRVDLVDEGVAGNQRRARLRTKFCHLNSGDAYPMVDEKIAKIRDC